MSENYEATKAELKQRVLARKELLEAKLKEAEKNFVKVSKADAEIIGHELKELGIRIHKGWDELSEAVVVWLNEWLKRTEPHAK